MDFFKSVATMAQNAIESINNPNHLTPDQLMQEKYHLPPTEHILNEINVEYIATSRVLYSFSEGVKNAGNYLPIPNGVNSRVLGRLTVTENYVVIKRNDTIFDKVIFHLATINKLQKIPNVEVVHVRLSTNNGMILDILSDTVKSKAEYFWHIFKKQYDLNKEKIGSLTEFQTTMYSEYLISKNCKNSKLGEKHLDVPLHPKGGLGLNYKFPGDQSREKEVAKLKRWFEYFRRYGRNLEIIENQIFNNLIIFGVPNRLRGEIWELSYGAMYLRFENKNEYQDILTENVDKTSLALEEIEKDLNRSLPEYPAFQTSDGINKLRRVLTAYSWKNPEIGYCQAMNIVVAALLIFMTEEQAYWTLNVLCEKLIPGYYSKTMYGVLLDQKVLEALVKKTMPLIGDHFTKYDIQLSIVSLPWFLSFFLNNMPLVFAFKVMDVFFYNGPKTLFQVALAIIKVNGPKLLDCADDGECIAVFKDYFLSLDEMTPANDKLKREFDVLWEVAFNEFNVIDDKLIQKHRNTYKNEVFKGIDLFVKRAEIRNLPKTYHITNDQISNVYDRYYRILAQDKSAPNRGNISIDFDSFKVLMSEVVPWVNLDRDTKDQNNFLRRLFDNWSDETGEMVLGTLVVGLDKIIEKDLMDSLSNFFALYDTENTGRISKETVLELAEDLIFITTPWREGLMFDAIANRELEDQLAEKIVQRREALIAQGVEIKDDEEISLPDEVKFDEEKWKTRQSVRYLSASSSFLQLAFKYAQPYEDPEEPLIDLEDSSDKKLESLMHNKALDPTHPVYITPSMFRMVILANETYASFFENHFWKSFDLDTPGNVDQGMFGGMVGNIRGMVNYVMADGVRVASQVRKKMDDARIRADTNASLESGSSLIASQSSSINKVNNRLSMDSKGAESVITGWTLESGALAENFDDSNIENLFEVPEEKGLLEDNREKEATFESRNIEGESEEDDDFGNFVSVESVNDVKEVTNKTNDLLI
jgi:Ca2+-binding EF-hand superfamily protein